MVVGAGFGRAGREPRSRAAYDGLVAATTARGERLLPWIAAERTARGLLLIAAGIYLLAHTGSNFGSIANHLARTIELDPHRPFIRHIVARLGRLRRHEIAVFGAAALAYGGLELVEGGGLFLRKRWAEWLTVVATTLLIPLELYELVRKPSALKGAGLIVNILIVLYLVRVVRRREQRQADDHD
jgi:uncharacterized membrane protein (DUF2068 family)